ncbi:MAG: hypothetical protein U0X75_19495 [Acidobacteriota bacterium]
MLTYADTQTAATKTVALNAARTTADIRLGVIGAGNFAKSVLLPRLAKLSRSA